MKTPLHVVALSGWGYDRSVWNPLCESAHDGDVYELLDWTEVLNGDRLKRRLRASRGRLVAVGWSLGALALLGALSDGEPLDGVEPHLLLVGATAAFPADPSAGYDGTPLSELRAMRTALRRKPVACLATFYERCESPRSPGSDLFERARRAVDQWGIAVLTAGLDRLAGTDLRGKVAGIRHPVLLVHGGLDAIVPLSHGKWLAGHLARSRLCILPKSGHALDPDTVHKIGTLIERHRETEDTAAFLGDGLSVEAGAWRVRADDGSC